jgi:tetratricopeptide (TPR) repeat protein
MDAGLARQAFVLTAQENFGLRVLDSQLGESPPSNAPPERLLRIRSNITIGNRSGCWSILIGTAATEHVLWEGSVLFAAPLNPKEESRLAMNYRHARAKYTKCLATAGFKPKSLRQTDAGIPDAAERLLKSMSETDQFAALRLLHSEMQNRGESPALVAALARGYSTLGLLTEYQWLGAPNVFKARSLLYAERLLDLKQNKASALWTRAYANGLSGFHILALKDLEAAAAERSRPTAPPWLEPLDAYLRFDAKRLKVAREKSDTPLVRLFQFLVAEQPETPSITIRSGREFLESEPECFRVHHAMCQTGGIGHLLPATATATDQFVRTLRDRIRVQPGLPQALIAALENPESSEAEVFSSLRSAKDEGQPSLTALASMLEDSRFALAWQRLYFLRHLVEVSARDIAIETAAALAGHPLRPLIESFEFDPASQPDALRQKLTAVDVDHLDTHALWYFHHRNKVDAGGAVAWHRRIMMNTGDTYADQSALVRSVHQNERERFAQNMESTSPISPLTVALVIARGSEKDIGRFPQFEKQYEDHPVVLRALGEQFMAQGSPKDAVRCWKRWLDLSPDWEAYLRLAEAKLGEDDESGWRATLESYLLVEDNDLGHARARAALARHYMKKGDFQEAYPFALAAAESGACWALILAAECEVGLGRWEVAEKSYRRAAERYPERTFDWYFAARSTGRLDAVSAERAVKELLARMPEIPGGSVALSAGKYHMLNNDMRRAAKLFKVAADRSRSDTVLLFAIIAAKATGDTRTLDLLQFESSLLLEKWNPAKKLCFALMEWMKRGIPPTEAELSSLIITVPEKGRSKAEFFMGLYLATQNRKEDALRHLERSLKQHPAHDQSYARIILRDAKRP